MLRVHYRAPESLPSHQRDFPPRPPPSELPGAEGVRGQVLFDSREALGTEALARLVFQVRRLWSGSAIVSV